DPDGALRLVATFQLESGDVVDWSPRLAPRHAHVGRIFDENGPVVGALVNLTCGLGSEGSAVGGSVETDEEGYFKFLAVPAAYARLDVRRDADSPAPDLVVPAACFDGRPLEFRLDARTPIGSFEIHGLGGRQDIDVTSLEFQYHFQGAATGGVLRLDQLRLGAYAIRDRRDGVWRGPVELSEEGGHSLVELGQLPALDRDSWAVFESDSGRVSVLDRRESLLGPLPPDGRLMECVPSPRPEGR
ncbi:MAG: carboxypeptidase regulatory-like domain-containing protein, partial [Planctomycetes bacterium]|nr:carboxypeptidase regulatory-like domain-containing protein [Planctomycetota bacterium]